MRCVASVMLFAAACSSSQPEAVVLQGRATYADGTVASSLPIEFTLLASGEGLFPTTIDNCDPGDAHAQALQVVNVTTSPDGTFEVRAPMAEFVRATDETCSMPVEVARNIARLDIQAAADANATTCGPYCRIHGEDTCDPDCAGRGQKFVSTSTLFGQTRAVIGVVFADLGPPLTVGSPSDPLPDLQVNGDAAQVSLNVSQQHFEPDDCVIADQCINAPGDRTLLRFDGDIENLGNGDLFIGSPDNNPLFTFSECHQHFHLANIMLFELLNAKGEPVFGDTGKIIGRKQGFCMEGIAQVAGNLPNLYTCENQGLAPGWEDVYDSALDCQWLDITGVPPGDYKLRITANPSRLFREIDYDNNAAIIPVTLPLTNVSHQ